MSLITTVLGGVTGYLGGGSGEVSGGRVPGLSRRGLEAIRGADPNSELDLGEELEQANVQNPSHLSAKASCRRDWKSWIWAKSWSRRMCRIPRTCQSKRAVGPQWKSPHIRSGQG